MLHYVPLLLVDDLLGKGEREKCVEGKMEKESREEGWGGGGGGKGELMVGTGCIQNSVALDLSDSLGTQGGCGRTLGSSRPTLGN